MAEFYQRCFDQEIAESARRRTPLRGSWRRVSGSPEPPDDVDGRASDFNVLGTRLCNFRRKRREGRLGVGEGERRVSVSPGQACNVDGRASDFNVLGAEPCNFRRERRQGRLGVDEGERRLSVSSGRTSNVDGRASGFNVLGTRLCNFRQERREGRLDAGEGEAHLHLGRPNLQCRWARERFQCLGRRIVQLPAGGQARRG